MEKLTKEEVEKITEKLKPYWKKFEDLTAEHSDKIMKLQKKMNKELSYQILLEFFYSDDGECVGIGAKKYSEREFFPLIHDSELDGELS